jgi:hypothetical protein
MNKLEALIDDGDPAEVFSTASYVSPTTIVACQQLHRHRQGHTADLRLLVERMSQIRMPRQRSTQPAHLVSDGDYGGIVMVIKPNGIDGDLEGERCVRI